MTVYLPYWLTGFAILVAAAFFLETRARRIASNCLLAYATAFVVLTLSVSLSGTARESKVLPMIDANRAELYLRFGRALTTLERFLPGSQGSIKKYDEFLLESEKILSKSTAKDPGSVVTKARLIIVAHELGRNVNGLIEELNAIKSENAKDLYKLLSTLYIQKRVANARTDEFKTLIDRHFRGFYRDTALIDLYRYSSQPIKLNQTKQAIEEHSIQFLKRLLFVMVFLILACFAGVLIILIQLFLLPGKMTGVSESLIASPVNWDFKTVYSVFIAWQATQLLVALIAQSTIKTMNILNWGVLPAALATAMIYLVSNAPGLFYIYLFALKPHGIGFLEGIKWRTRVGNFGSGRLVLAGVMTWLAAIPIVLSVFLLIARHLGSQGSSNPIISLVMEAAHAGSLPATAVFYFTLGVLAPFCEESLFRGFLYSALRKHLGVFLSVLISGSLFAAVHLDVGGFLLLMCLGCLFGLLLERTQSILPSIVAHGLWNSGTFSLVLMLFAD